MKQAEMNMADGTCSMYRTVGIPLKVKQGDYDKLENWEKLFFHDGIRNGLWNKSGVHLKNNNPYSIDKKHKITENKNVI
tara:strand:- start:166 stop:402 length:237 start_codon:yes stop_codon:yes gene_type:complete